VNRENVQKLIDHLKRIPTGAFDLSSWITVTRPELYADIGLSRFNKNKIIDALRSDPKAARKLFAMQAESDGTHTCGTAACIAGYAVMLQAAETAEIEPSYCHCTYSDQAGGWLGLDYDEGRALFTPNLGLYDSDKDRTEIRADYVPKWTGVTVQHAIAVLEHLLATGEVDWRVAPWSDAERAEQACYWKELG
jgi:hypothetical protein